jgi:hypothetical protein
MRFALPLNKGSMGPVYSSLKGRIETYDAHHRIGNGRVERLLDEFQTAGV